MYMEKYIVYFFIICHYDYNRVNYVFESAIL